MQQDPNVLSVFVAKTRQILDNTAMWYGDACVILTATIAMLATTFDGNGYGW